MRKNIALTIMALLLAGSAWAQEPEYKFDSAIFVVKQYLQKLNHQSIRADSMLYIESYIYDRETPTDTLVMKRWYVAPNLYRSEVWHGDTVQEILYSNARNLFRWYDGEKGNWQDLSPAWYYDKAEAYNFHGPLHNWNYDGSELSYQGIWRYNGQEAYRIFIQCPSRYDRFYLFEKESGLLFLIDEQTEHNPDMQLRDGKHVEWRAIHEYTPLGEALFPTVESYQFEGRITLIFSKVQYMPINMNLFMQDQP